MPLASRRQNRVLVVRLVGSAKETTFDMGLKGQGFDQLCNFRGALIHFVSLPLNRNFIGIIEAFANITRLNSALVELVFILILPPSSV
jgi:hypothetical protein